MDRASSLAVLARRRPREPGRVSRPKAGLQARRRMGAGLAVAVGVHLALFVRMAVSGPEPPEPVAVTLVSLGMEGGPTLVSAPTDPAPSPVPSPPQAASEPLPPEPTPPTPADTNVGELAARMIAQVNSPLELEPVDLEAQPAPQPQPVQQAVSDPAPDGADAAACDITESVRLALQQDVAVQIALTHIPRDVRSVANAIMLWDGRWAESATMGGAPAFEPIRAAIVGRVMAATPVCRDQAVRGPRFITIAASPVAAVLAVGSGEWRWSQLAEAITDRR